MSFLEKVYEWVARHHPEYEGWDIEIMASKFNISEPWGEIKNKIQEATEDTWGTYLDIDDEEMAEVVQDINAPIGFLFVTLVKDGERVCVLLPSNFKDQI